MSRHVIRTFELTCVIAVGVALVIPFEADAAQYARPDGTLAADTWTPGGLTPQPTLHESTDEVAPNDDNDYMVDTADNATAELSLSDVTDPGVGTGHIMRFRFMSSGGGQPEQCDLELYEGNTRIARLRNQVSRGAYDTKTYTLSAAEADSITDYTDLRFRIIDNIGNGESMRVTWAELEVPDAFSPPTLSNPTHPFATIETTQAVLGATIDSDGGSAITNRGTVWNTTGAPITENAASEGGTAIGAYSHTRNTLPSATLIYFRGIAQTAAGTGYSPDASFYTEPIRASNVMFSSVGYSNMTISWANGNGAGRLVVMKEGSAVTTSPTDGTEHSANAAFGSGTDLGGNEYVVYRAAGTSVTVTALSPISNYFVAVFEYAGSSTQVNYEQGAPATGNQATLTPTVPNLSNPSVTNIDITSATLSATIDDDGGAAITNRGTVWNTTGDPVTENGASAGGTATGVFTHARSSLPSATRVYYRGFADNVVGRGYSVSSSFYTEPIQASNILFTATDTTNITITWANGNGDGRLVIMKQGSAVTTTPDEGTEHSPNAAFGSGENMGGNEYVVYRAAGTNVTVTALTPGATYHIAIFEYAGSGALINYQQDAPAISNETTTFVATAPTLSSPTAPFATVDITSATLGATIDTDGGSAITNRGTVWNTSGPPITENYASAGGTALGAFSDSRSSLPGGTLIYYRGLADNTVGRGYSPDGEIYTEPIQASNVMFSSVGSSTMTVSWASGGGDGSLVVMKAGGAVGNQPTDGVAHNANAAFMSGANLGGGEYVVYRSSGTSVTVSALSGGVTYHVAIFEYAGSATQINYQQDSPETGSQLTQVGGTPPTLSAPTHPFATIDTTQADLGATVDTDGGSAVTSRGTVWDTNATPTANSLQQGSGLGTFSHTRSGLVPGTLHYFRGWASNSTGIAYSPEAQFYTEPTQATDVYFPSAGIGFASLTIGWTNGGGDGQIVLVKEGSAVDAAPTDGSNYTASTVFGSGSELGTGNYVVFAALDNESQVSISALNDQTTYHVAVFEYAGSSTQINYQQDTPATGNETTTMAPLPSSGHNLTYSIDCKDCHFLHTGPAVVTGFQQESQVCGTCHNPSGVASNKSDITVHLADGTNYIMDCGTCHDVHNNPEDRLSTDVHTAQTKTNLFYLRSDITNYLPQAIGPLVFHESPANYAFASNDAPWNGACQVCHTNTTRHRNDNTTDNDHNVGMDCMSCHGHDGGFVPTGGGGCTTCHNSPQDDGDGNPPNGRRAILGEFSLSSHHVTGTVTDADCEVCHDQSQHQQDEVRLFNVDNTNTVYVMSNSQDPATNSTEAAKLTAFCLACHDGDGAGGSAPFSDGVTPPEISNATWSSSSHALSPLSCYGDGSSFGCHNSGHGSEKRKMLAPFDVTPDPTSKVEEEEGFCFSCHDGSVATNIASAFQGSTTWTVNAVGDFANTDLNDRHDFDYAAQQRSGAKIECVDCHNPHEATTAQPVKTDPDPSDGRVPGTGAVLSDGTFMTEWCLDCHDGSYPSTVTAPSTQIQNIRQNWLSTGANPDTHGQANGNVGTLEAGYGWTVDITMNCLDCHVRHISGKKNLYHLKDRPRTASDSADIPTDSPPGGFNFQFTINNAKDPPNNGYQWCNTCHENSMGDKKENCGSCHYHGGGKF